MIEIENLTKRFGPKTAVDRLSLRVEPGQIYACLGPNGAGKTTTIKILAGLLRPTSGGARICGHDVVADGKQAKRVLAYVPDEPYLYEKLSGREFLDFVGRLHGLSGLQRASRAEEFIELFEMGDYIDDLTERYSHGMKQRVVISSALIHDPRSMVVDEPMVGLDPKGMRIFKDVLAERSRAGMSVFMSTHTLAVAEEVAHRIGIIHMGAKVAEGTAEELRGRALSAGGGFEDFYLGITGGLGGRMPPSTPPSPISGPAP